MASDLPFACQCGAVTGIVGEASPSNGDRVVCHCADCRDLVRHLGQEERVLDANGGTDLYQSRCARVKLHTGQDRLASLHMTAGSTLRWYAACCNSPLFNTYANGKLPYITTILANCDRATTDAALGEPRRHLFVEQATGETAGLKEMSFNSLLRRFFWRMLKDFVSVDRRKSALFDRQTLQPIATPVRLTSAQKARLGRK